MFEQKWRDHISSDKGLCVTVETQWTRVSFWPSLIRLPSLFCSVTGSSEPGPVRLPACLSLSCISSFPFFPFLQILSQHINFSEVLMTVLTWLLWLSRSVQATLARNNVEALCSQGQWTFPWLRTPRFLLYFLRYNFTYRPLGDIL